MRRRLELRQPGAAGPPAPSSRRTRPCSPSSRARRRRRGSSSGCRSYLDGTDSPRTQSTRAFARNIEDLGLPILLWDERWSTQAVERTLIEQDASRARRAELIDKMAAAYILQGRDRCLGHIFLNRSQHDSPFALAAGGETECTVWRNDLHGRGCCCPSSARRCSPGCAPIIAGYSLQAYTNATELKAETLAMIDASGDPYDGHAAAIAALQIKLNAAYEFSRGTAYNEQATAMWRIIRNPSEQHSLLGQFFALWKKQGTTSPYYRQAKRGNITLAFDRLICLEANKKESTRCPAFPTGVDAQPAEDDTTNPVEATHG